MGVGREGGTSKTSHGTGRSVVKVKNKCQDEGQTSEINAWASGLSVEPQKRDWKRQGHRSSSKSNLRARQGCTARHSWSSKNELN